MGFGLDFLTLYVGASETEKVSALEVRVTKTQREPQVAFVPNLPRQNRESLIRDQNLGSSQKRPRTTIAALEG